MIGGRVGAAGMTAASNTNVVEEYDPATDAWGGVRARMPSARSAMASGVYGGRIDVTGGEFQDSQMMATFRALEAYDPASNTWAVLPSMPVARHGLAGAVVGHRLHMVSGGVQPAGTGVHVHAPYHDAFELGHNRRLLYLPIGLLAPFSPEGVAGGEVVHGAEGKGMGKDRGPGTVSPVTHVALFSVRVQCASRPADAPAVMSGMPEGPYGRLPCAQESRMF